MSTALYVIIVSVIIFLYIFFIFSRKWTKNKAKKTDSLYTLGLNHMLHNENEKAIECFTDYLKVNTKNIDAYIKLGVLYRKTDRAKKALNIHENLLFRQDITGGQRLSILNQLCEDHIALAQFEHAIKKAKDLLKLDKNNRYANEVLYQLYRDNHEWQNAIDALKKNKKVKNKARLMTLYKVQQGLEAHYKKGEYHNARLIFRKAIKYDPACEAPFYYMGLSYVKDQREEDAIEWWEKFVETAPDKAYIVFPNLKKILFNLGKFEQIDTFLRNILKKTPDNTETIIALSEFYENKGDIDRAIAIIDEKLKTQQSDIKLQISQAKFYAVKNDCRKTSSILIDVLEKYNANKIRTCSNCGHQVKSPTWFCENCQEIDTFIN